MKKVSKYYENGCRFNGVFSRNNLPGIKDEAYVINLDDKKKKKWGNTLGFIISWQKYRLIDCFAIEFISQEILKKIKNKWINDNIFRIQDDESIMCRFYCNAFIEYTLA